MLQPQQDRNNEIDFYVTDLALLGKRVTMYLTHKMTTETLNVLHLPYEVLDFVEQT